jgi:hypothetical protein
MNDFTLTKRRLLSWVGACATGAGLVTGRGDATETNQPAAADIVLGPDDLEWAFEPHQLDPEPGDFVTGLTDREPEVAGADVAVTGYSAATGSTPPLSISLVVILPGGLPAAETIDEVIRTQLEKYQNEWGDRFAVTREETSTPYGKRWTIDIQHRYRRKSAKDVYTRQLVDDTLLVTAGYTYQSRPPAQPLAERTAKILRTRRQRWD